MGLQALPALPRTTALYLAAHKDRYAMATLNRRLSAIAAAHRMADHPFDTRCREIALVMAGLRRTKTIRQRQVHGLDHAVAQARARHRPKPWQTDVIVL